MKKKRRPFVTDKFLWDLYGFLETTKDVVDFIIASPYKKAAMIAPGNNPVFRKYQRDMGKLRFSKFIYALKKRNYIQSHTLKNTKAVVITKKGLERALRASFRESELPKRSDGKLIMLIFDLPARYKRSRELLRDILVNLGYSMFQQSVWITPYDVSEKTEKLLQYHSLDEFVRIFIIEEI